jgi:hypothetical protein
LRASISAAGRPFVTQGCGQKSLAVCPDGQVWPLSKEPLLALSLDLLCKSINHRKARDDTRQLWTTWHFLNHQQILSYLKSTKTKRRAGYARPAMKKRPALLKPAVINQPLLSICARERSS